MSATIVVAFVELGTDPSARLLQPIALASSILTHSARAPALTGDRFTELLGWFGIRTALKHLSLIHI